MFSKFLFVHLIHSLFRNVDIKNCVSPNTHKIALDVQNQCKWIIFSVVVVKKKIVLLKKTAFFFAKVHCLSYEQSDTVCKGNSYNEVVAMVRDIQQRARIEKQSSGVVSPISKIFLKKIFPLFVIHCFCFY